ncbi:ankyrin unc44 [Fusarium langsethiae]|uniref:Ankyrin unc44 n=1 Tax=Fusarium langsethiae TaxID=179993 RepID=A0A0N0DAE1_FUSLA|nr:ankyrin unc44 [Fusarium langsethiae]
MSFAETGRATVSVGEVAAISDAELVQFMQQHRLPYGDYDLPVDGWERLSEDERSRLAERLEAEKRSLAQNPTACSRPLELDGLDARLRQALPNSSFSLLPGSQAIDPPESPTTLLNLEVHRTKDEIGAYHGLINDSGRPLYPIELIQYVYKDPDNYAEMLRPWQEHLTPISPSGIFQRQWQRWQDFRKWQNDNRGRDDDDGGFPATRARLLAEIEADPSCLKSEWDQKQFLRRRQRRLYREHGCRGFCGYAKAVKRRLASHSFTQPFELDEDPKKQHQ